MTDAKTNETRALTATGKDDWLTNALHSAAVMVPEDPNEIVEAKHDD